MNLLKRSLFMGATKIMLLLPYYYIKLIIIDLFYRSFNIKHRSFSLSLGIMGKLLFYVGICE
jgi:hypothetical protein